MTITEKGQEFVEHFSEKPWSDYTAADYSIEQWHAACLIHLHDGPPTSKSQCKLPVKTPSGAVNKNGVHAAAGALAGARGGVHASAEQKAKAASTLRHYYSQMGEKPPPSLAEHSDLNEIGREFIDHSGVKGMKWGVRRSEAQLGKRQAGDKKEGGGEKKLSGAAKEAHTKNSRKPETSIDKMSDKQLKDYVNRINLEQQYARLQPTPWTRKAGKFVTDIAVGVAKQQITNALSAQVSSAIAGAKVTKARRSGIIAPNRFKTEFTAPTGPRIG